MAKHTYVYCKIVVQSNSASPSPHTVAVGKGHLVPAGFLLLFLCIKMGLGLRDTPHQEIKACSLCQSLPPVRHLSLFWAQSPIKLAGGAPFSSWSPRYVCPLWGGCGVCLMLGRMVSRQTALHWAQDESCWSGDQPSAHCWS